MEALAALQKAQLLPIKELGRGQFGDVYLANQQQFGLVAAKIIPSSKYDQKEWETAGILVNKIGKNRNIVGYCGAKAQDDFVIILMEYANLASLDKLTGLGTRLGEDNVRMIVGQLLDGIGAIHSVNLIHRDIKPDNIMMHYDQTNQSIIMKITDFGLTKNQDHGLAQTQVGTPLYMAPEILDYQGAFTNKVDVWAVGLMFYQLIFGKLPFRALDMNQLKMAVRNQIQKLAGIPISEQCWNLIQNMLAYHPSQRYSTAQALQHPFMQPWVSAGKPLLPANVVFSVSRDLFEKYSNTQQKIISMVPQVQAPIYPSQQSQTIQPQMQGQYYQQITPTVNQQNPPPQAINSLNYSQQSGYQSNYPITQLTNYQTTPQGNYNMNYNQYIYHTPQSYPQTTIPPYPPTYNQPPQIQPGYNYPPQQQSLYPPGTMNQSITVLPQNLKPAGTIIRPPSPPPIVQREKSPEPTSEPTQPITVEPPKPKTPEPPKEKLPKDYKWISVPLDAQGEVIVPSISLEQFFGQVEVQKDSQDNQKNPIKQPPKTIFAKAKFIKQGNNRNIQSDEEIKENWNRQEEKQPDYNINNMNLTI